MKISIRRYMSLRYSSGWDIFVSEDSKLENLLDIGSIFEKGDIWAWKINRFVKEFGIFPKESESASPEEAKREVRKYLNDSHKKWKKKPEVEQFQSILIYWGDKIKELTDDSSLTKERWNRLQSYNRELRSMFNPDELVTEEVVLNCCLQKDAFDMVLDSIIGVSFFCREGSNVRTIAEDIRQEVEEAIRKHPILS